MKLPKAVAEHSRRLICLAGALILLNLSLAGQKLLNCILIQWHEPLAFLGNPVHPVLAAWRHDEA